jgi:hypothetical protein
MHVLLSDSKEISEYRETLSNYILRLLGRCKSKATLADIENLILNDDGVQHRTERFVDLFALFNLPDDRLDTVLPIIQDAWNYFPHRSLGGRCPAEVMAENLRVRKGRPPVGQRPK